MKMDIVIPFNGFYESTACMLLSDETESLFQDDSGNSDVPDAFHFAYGWNTALLEGYAREYVQAFAQEVGDKLDIDLSTLEFKSLYSPREYNFESDRITCTIDITAVQLLWELASPMTLQALIAERHTSRSGFISFYTNTLSSWPVQIREWDKNQLETLLLAAMSDAGIEEVDEYDLMDRARGNGVLSSLIWDNMNDDAKAIANAWYKENREAA